MLGGTTYAKQRTNNSSVCEIYLLVSFSEYSQQNCLAGMILKVLQLTYEKKCWTSSLFVLNQLSLLNLTLSINKDKVETCLGKDIRDVINDICHIIRIWQKKVLIEYNRKFKNEHKYLYCKFAHLFYDVKVNTSNGDNRIKERLIK
ncbi:unnamed protein product [Rhizophagus irregularis]|nr:unnamed protein product [Rhizophagus irregularis]CAB5363610.1 unnamed protein product [Rhizophagus irregularis]